MGEHPFPDITADDILRSIRKSSLRLAVKMAVCFFLMAAVTVLSVFMLIAVHRSIGEMLLWGMLALYSIFYNCICFPEFRTHLRNYRDPASAEIFRLYGKPEKIVEKMIVGRIEKFYKENCLLDQEFIKDSDKTVQQVVNEAIAKIGEKIDIRRYTRYELGEGLQKRSDDFVSEVMAQVK